jgi:RNA recognition motif-containing protein
MQMCYERHTAKHLGYAIAHFDNPAAAQYAINMLHNSKLHGRHIVVAPYKTKVRDASAPQAMPAQSSPREAKGAVALVMNLSKNTTWM